MPNCRDANCIILYIYTLSFYTNGCNSITHLAPIHLSVWYRYSVCRQSLLKSKQLKCIRLIQPVLSYITRYTLLERTAVQSLKYTMSIRKYRQRNVHSNNMHCRSRVYSVRRYTYAIIYSSLFQQAEQHRRKRTSSSAMAERPRELGDFKKARVNGGMTITLLRIRTSVSAAADRPASYGNQIISSTRPSCMNTNLDGDARTTLRPTIRCL